MFGAVMDAVMSIPNNMMMEEDRNQRQQDAWGHKFNDQQFIREMSSTAHQRQVQDLRLAGLNPIFSARLGGASGGSAAQAGGSGGTPGQVRSNFTQAQLNSAQEELLKAQKISTDQQAYNYSADTEKKKQETQLLLEQQKTQEQLTHSARHNAEILGHDEKGRRLEGQIDETRYGEVMRYIDRAIRAITGAGSAYGNAAK